MVEGSFPSASDPLLRPSHGSGHPQGAVTNNKRTPCGFRYPPGEQRLSFMGRCHKHKSFKGLGLQIGRIYPYKNLTHLLYYGSRTLLCGCLVVPVVAVPKAAGGVGCPGELVKD
jgi:hypothetical protein